MDNYQAIYKFWKGFGLPAYDEQTVFAENEVPTYPHITYESADGMHGATALLSASIWDRALVDGEANSSWKTIKAKADEIKKEIGLGGKIIRVEGGGLWIKIPESSPFSRPGVSDSDNTIRIIMNIEVDFIGG